MTGALDRLLAAFEQRAGGRPEGVWAAPGRVNIIGEHTDYNDGFVLPVAIDRETLAAVRRRPDGVMRCWSLEEGEAPPVTLGDLRPGSAGGWAAYAHGVAWALGQEGVAVGGADVVIASEVPVGAGLSSSAALESAVALALADLHDCRLGRRELALVAQRAETDIVGVPVGVMDQMAALLGRAGHALFLDTRSMEAEPIPFRPEQSGLLLVVIDTRVAHKLADGAYADRRRACAEAARVLDVAALRDVSLEEVEAAAGVLGDVGLRRARHVVSENARVLLAVERLRAGEVGALGPLLAASHASLRDDYEVSCEELDVAVASATAAGAVGARMTGGGFGGSAVAIVPDDRLKDVADHVAGAFAERGFAAPSVFPVRAADGARRLEWAPGGGGPPA